MKTCRFCAEEVKQEAIKCKHCGSMLNYWEDETTPIPHETHQQVDTNKHKISLEIPNIDPKKQVQALLLMIGGIIISLYSLYILISGFSTYFFDDMGYLFKSVLLFVGAIILLAVATVISPTLMMTFECSVCSSPLVINYGKSKSAADIVNCLKCETMHVVNWYESK